MLLGGVKLIIVGLFTKYFLLLMIFQGILVGFIDASNFKRNKMKDTARKARIIGIGSIVLGIILFTARALK